jgi:hypothetical protein
MNNNLFIDLNNLNNLFYKFKKSYKGLLNENTDFNKDFYKKSKDLVNLIDKKFNNLTHDEKINFIENNLKLFYSIYKFFLSLKYKSKVNTSGKYKNIKNLSIYEYIDKNTIPITTNQDDLMKILKIIKGILNTINTDKRFGFEKNVFYLRVARFFIKIISGLTYFNSQNLIPNQYPIYHRNASCGSNIIKLKDKFTLLSTNSSLEKTNKRQALKICYIERLIYNEVFKYFLGDYQDLEHNFERGDTEALFTQYFPYDNYKVYIFTEDNMIRIVHRIVKEKDNAKLNLSYNSKRKNSIIYIETYKHNDNGTVDCEKIKVYNLDYKYNGSKNIDLTENEFVKYTKTQTFNKEAKWKLDKNNLNNNNTMLNYNIF